MYGAILGFQRCDWWPKCAPDSRSWRMVKSGRDTAFSFPVKPRRTIAAGAKPPSPERTLKAGRAKIRLWNGRAYTGGRGEKQGQGCGYSSARELFAVANSARLATPAFPGISCPLRLNSCEPK